MPELWLGKGPDGARIALPPESLTTHGVCVGMTGSGKTGLCVSLIEEVAGAGVPVIAIDPKGDLTNLALTEPDAAAAEGWRKGQAAWGVTDVAAWRDRVQTRIWTPGSDAGLSVDVLGALRRPAELGDDETRRELVTGCVSALLGLVGEEADPVRSPAHVVLARILEDAWLAGHDPDLPALLQALVDPPFAKVGVFPTDKFFPPDARMDLALRLNALLASPSFAAWAEGAPLDIPAMLRVEGGRAPVHVFTLAHLSEPERHFFVGLLLDRIAAWTRTLPGTSSLRALVFFDEVWGFLPPHPKNPPSKRPLLALLKQARAVGVGTVLATQNPIDLDYKALSNAGTWFVGRLQTRNDRDRVLEGLTGSGMERADAEKLLDGVAPRRFLLHRAGKSPTFLDTRWTRVFLAGPLTRPQLRALRDAAPQRPPAAPVTKVAPRPAGPARLPAWPRSQWVLDPRVVFGARMDGAFTPYAEPAGDTVRLRPGLLVRLALRFDEEKAGFVEERAQTRLYFPLEDALPLAPLLVPIEDADLLEAPPAGAAFDDIPAWLDDGKEIDRAGKQVVDAVMAEEATGMWSNPVLKLAGRAGESREDFDARCRAAVEERLAEALQVLQAKVAKKVEAAEDKVRRAEEARDRHQTSVESKQAQEWANVGQTVLGFFTGRRANLNTVATKRRQVIEAQQKASSADGEVARASEALYALEAELERDAAALRVTHEQALSATVQREIRLERDDVRIVAFGLCWVPVSRRM